MTQNQDQDQDRAEDADGTPGPDETMAFIATRWPEWERHGIGPDGESIRNAAAVGIVEIVWRNSPLEDMHAGGGRRGRGPSDGEMFAESVSLQRMAYAALGPYTYRYHPDDDPWDAPRRVSEPGLDPSRLCEFEDHVLDTQRPWAAGGRTLREMGWGYLGAFRRHVKGTLDWVYYLSKHYGYQAALGRLIAITGGGIGGYGDEHYGMPRWPAVARGVRDVLADPDHRGWVLNDGPVCIAAAPPGTPEPDELYRILLAGPDKLPVATLDWLASQVMFAARIAEGDARQPAPGCSCSWCLQRQAEQAHITVLDQLRAALPAPGTTISVTRHGDHDPGTGAAWTVISAFPGTGATPVTLKVRGPDGAEAHASNWGDRSNGQWHWVCGYTKRNGEPCGQITQGGGPSDRCSRHEDKAAGEDN